MSLGGRRRSGGRFGVPNVVAAPSGLALPGPLVGLVQDGLQSYAGSIGLVDTRSLSWSVDQRLERPDSTVFRILANPGAGPSLVCFVKSFRVPEHRPEMEQRLRDRVERSGRLTHQTRRPGSGAAAPVPEVLASDPDLLAIVSVGVDGERLGKAWHHLITPGRRIAARKTFTAVGRAIRDVESMSLGRVEPTTFLDEANVERALERILPYVSSPQATRIAEAVSELQKRHSAAPEESYYCHGDINHSNVLVDGAKINLIDFDLSSRPRTFDLSIFLLRLRLERPSIPWWREKVSAWVVEGYGQPDVTETPAYALVRLIKLSNGIENQAKRNNHRRLRRYVAALEESLPPA